MVKEVRAIERETTSVMGRTRVSGRLGSSDQIARRTGATSAAGSPLPFTTRLKLRGTHSSPSPLPGSSRSTGKYTVS